jgi:hypothetical protein
MVKHIFLAICFVPSLNIAGLLMAGDNPPIYWQKLAGVSVSVGTYTEEVNQAYAFLERVRKTGKDAKIYTVSFDIVTSVFHNIGIYEKLFKPDLPSFTVQNTTDWQLGFVVRVNDLLESDYLLIKTGGTQHPKSLIKAKYFGSMESERKAFEVFFILIR